jgi:hypothetical protein
VANNNAAYFKGSTTTNQSYGPYIDAGTSSTDYAFNVRDVTGANTYFKIRGDGAATFSSSVTSAGFTTAGIGSFGQAETTIIKMSAATTLSIKNNAGTIVAQWDHSTGVFTQSYPATFSSTVTGGLVGKTGTYTPGSTTVDVTGVSYMVIANSSAISITNFTGAVNGQILILNFSDSNTTITRNNCYLAGGANFTSTSADILVLVFQSPYWQEISRSANS